MIRTVDPPHRPPDGGGVRWIIALVAMSTLSGVLGLVCRLQVYTGPGRKFMSDYAIDFAWVPMTTFVLLGIAMPMWRSTCLPRRVVQLGVLGMTMLELYLELAQLGDGAAPYFEQPSGWLQVVSNWLHEHQGNVFSWGDMLAFGVSGVLTYLAIERSGMCAAAGSPVNRRLMPRGRVARTAVTLLVLPVLMLPTMAFEQKIGGNAADNARADTGGGSSEDQYGCSAGDRENAKDYAKKQSRKKFGSRHWRSLEKLWDGESGWCYKADNPNSTAHGIPQALGSKHKETTKGSWRRSYKKQIDWGLGYIEDRYGDPSKAYTAWKRRSPHWYMIKVPVRLPVIWLRRLIF